MSKPQKLIDRIRKIPSDFTYDELRTLLNGLGYVEVQSGKTAVKFINLDLKHIVRLHRPNSENILKMYQTEDILSHFESRGAF